MLALGDLKAKIARVGKVKFLNLPTQLEEMTRLSKHLHGPSLWIKRDDCTGLAFGGNKERKTEFVMADALRKKADVVVTTGAVQSNHVRATIAAGRKVGLEATVVLQGQKPSSMDGNFLLDSLLGADIRFVEVDWREVGGVMEEVAVELKREGRNPYVIPSGASYAVGAVAYVEAMVEMLTQAERIGFKIDHIVHAAGSGGTQAGLVLANKALDGDIEIHGVCAGEECGWLVDRTVSIANSAAELLGLSVTVDNEDVSVVEGYAGEGYGVVGRECVDAIKLLARMEGILLDPVYTGKAMVGLIDMIRLGRFREGENVVFVHTGGVPALFPYREDLQRFL